MEETGVNLLVVSFLTCIPHRFKTKIYKRKILCCLFIKIIIPSTYAVSKYKASVLRVCSEGEKAVCHGQVPRMLNSSDENRY